MSRQFDASTITAAILFGLLAMVFAYAWVGLLFIGLTLILLGIGMRALPSSRRALECNDCHNRWERSRHTGT